MSNQRQRKEDERVEFTFEVTYFKESGKLYIREEDIKLKCEPLSDGSPYMQDIVDQLKQMRSDKKLPGLQSGNWDGYILIDQADGHPCLIVPEVKQIYNDSNCTHCHVLRHRISELKAEREKLKQDILNLMSKDNEN